MMIEFEKNFKNHRQLKKSHYNRRDNVNNTWMCNFLKSKRIPIIALWQQLHLED